MSQKLDYEAELQLELQTVEQSLSWWDYKLSSEDAYMAPQERLDLLKKKWAIQMGLKNLGKIYG